MIDLKIDVHTHIFNSNDIPLYGIIKNVDIPKVPNKIEKKVFDIAGKMLDALFDILTEDENYTMQFVNKKVNIKKQNIDEIFEIIANTDDEIKSKIEDIMKDNEKLSLEEIEQLKEEFHEFDTSKKSLLGLTVGFVVVIIVKSILGNLINWIKHLAKSRKEIVKQLKLTYKSIDLFVPLFMDMEMWFDGNSDKSFQLQIDELSKLVIKEKGLVHPFIAFDPKRAMKIGTDNLLGIIKTAIYEKGFIGVKLYPPMGYQASGDKYSVILKELYQFCSDHQIPITAHCSPTGMEAKKGISKKKSKPVFWKKVLNEYSDLKVNLAHFGGEDHLVSESNKSWTYEINEMMKEYDNLFADSGFHQVQKSGKRKKIKKSLKLLMKESNLEDRYMFGTDWHMIVKKRDADKYLTNYEDIYKDLDFGNTELALEKFLCRNAVEFLGLKTGHENRKRLELFYEKNMIETPKWMHKVDQLVMSN